MANDSYYWCSSVLLEVGAVVKPGNWGRMIKCYGARQQGSWEVLYRELALESVRKMSFPDKPSRLESIFLSRTLDESNFFKFRTNRAFDVTYRVKLVQPKLPIHFANFTFVSPNNWMQQESIITSMEECAVIYWQDGVDHGDVTEVLTTSPIEILEICN